MVRLKYSKVYEDGQGVARCGACSRELACNKSGDIPEVCPRCKAALDWSFYSNPTAQEPAQCLVDAYGNEYELYSRKIYISKGVTHGNVAAYIPGSINNGLHVIYYGPLSKQKIEQAIISNGWRLEDWL